MKVYKFTAKDMQAALDLVKLHLGPEATVVKTRKVSSGGPLSWLGRPQIEVTAAKQPDAGERPLPPRRRVRNKSIRNEPAGPINSAAEKRTDTTVPERPSPWPTSTPASAAPTAGESLPNHEDLCQQLLDLQSFVQQIRSKADQSGANELPACLFSVFTDLIEADIPESVARSLIEEARFALGDEANSQPQSVQLEIERGIESSLEIGGDLQIPSGQQRIVALVGPTGVGKTTTVAKLAANFRLREKRKVALVTADTYRIAAVDQLQTYAEIIDLPMEVVRTPREMTAALERLQDQDLILMDTAGRSPHDEVKLQELESLFAEARPHEVHLVLSAASGAANLHRAAEQFAAAGTTSLILTKLDEATSFGHLLSLLRQAQLPLSYVTDGQNVPDDIEPAQAKKLTHLILNGRGSGAASEEKQPHENWRLLQ